MREKFKLHVSKCMKLDKYASFLFAAIIVKIEQQPVFWYGVCVFHTRSKIKMNK